MTIKANWLEYIQQKSEDFARASMALAKLQVGSNCVSCQEMHVSAKWIIKEYRLCRMLGGLAWLYPDVRYTQEHQ